MDPWNVCPTTPPPQNLDRSGRMVWLALGGYPRLAADTILIKSVKGKIGTVVGNAIRQLNLEFLESQSTRKHCYETLIETALNLTGLERKRAGFSDGDTEAVLGEIVEALKGWEAQERKEGVSLIITEVVQSQIMGMKRVLFGQGMVSKMGESVERSIDAESVAESFLSASRNEVQGNVYYKIVDQGLSKLGNDSATGLRWLRHLGAVQVSSNPVIAARAYEELPDLWQKFEPVIAAHPEWRDDPSKSGDEVAMLATVNGLLPNLLDFRPIALLSDFEEGMVSIQLNPFKAGSKEESVGDALKIYSILQDILLLYDAHLMGGSDFEGRGRPNVVFKVASGNAVALETTEALDKLGIGTNNTVTYTVSQEIMVARAAMKGLAGARLAGIPPTRVYVTNMEGRLEDHLREVQAAVLLKRHLGETDDADQRIREIAERLGLRGELEGAGTLDEMIALLCARKNLKTLTEDWFANLVPASANLARMEQDIRWAGILVTRRVFGLAFGPRAAPIWEKHLQATMGLSLDQAKDAVSRVDLLPASKRREDDTYQVLGGKATKNLTNTEFPDQQLKVWLHSRKNAFDLSDFENSIARSEPEVLARLLALEDFRKAYELTGQLSKELNELGIDVPREDGGLEPGQWDSYGPVVKTMREFKGAYLTFRNRLVQSLEQRQTVSPFVGR
ncbi:MAG TPA: transaldolase family protein [Nitrososphaerales archaeon]|nr:transaldolase family protein [Nitrososphaerales archaeon]